MDEQVEFRILNSGQPRISSIAAEVIAKGESIVALEIDMHSKYCEVGSMSVSIEDELALSVNAVRDRSVGLDLTQACEFTEICFPGYKSPDWRIFSADCCRYTLRVVLVKYPLEV